MTTHAGTPGWNMASSRTGTPQSSRTQKSLATNMCLCCRGKWPRTAHTQARISGGKCIDSALLLAVICHWPSGAYPGRRNPAGKAPQGWSAALQARKYEMHEAHQYVQTRANGPYLDNQIGCFHHSSFQQFFVTGGGSDTSSAQAGGRTM